LLSISKEDLDIKVLRIQNKHMSDRLLQRQKLEANLRDKIEKLQNRKVADDNKLCIFDRYWTQLDEDLGVLLERVATSDMSTDMSIKKEESSSSNARIKNEEPEDGEYGDDSDQMHVDTISTTTDPKCTNFRNFLAKLENWDRVDLEENLKERVKFTTQTVAKLMTNHERLG
jgi:hypothetical protein